MCLLPFYPEIRHIWHYFPHTEPSKRNTFCAKYFPLISILRSLEINACLMDYAVVKRYSRFDFDLCTTVLLWEVSYTRRKGPPIKRGQYQLFHLYIIDFIYKHNSELRFIVLIQQNKRTYQKKVLTFLKCRIIFKCGCFFELGRIYSDPNWNVIAFSVNDLFM